MLAAGVAIQRDILPSSVEQDGSYGYMRKGATVQFTGTGYTRTSDEFPRSPFGNRPKSLMNEQITIRPRPHSKSRRIPKAGSLLSKGSLRLPVDSRIRGNDECGRVRPQPHWLKARRSRSVADKRGR